MKKNRKKIVWLAFPLALIMVAGLVLTVWRPWGNAQKPGDGEFASTGDPVLDYLIREGNACGYENAFSQLTLLSSAESDGLTFHRYQQHYEGLAVEGQSVVCVTDQAGNILSVTGNIEDVDANLSLTPTAEPTAVEASIKTRLEEELGTEVTDIDFGELSEDKLCIHGRRNRQDQLAYKLNVKFTVFGADCACYMVVHANTGAVLYMEGTTPAGEGDATAATTMNVEADSGEIYENVVCEASEDGGYYLIDHERQIYMKQGEKKQVCKVFNITYENALEDEDYRFDDANPPEKTVLDAYVHTQKAYDYFDEYGMLPPTGMKTFVYTNITFVPGGDVFGNADTYPKWDYVETSKIKGLSVNEYIRIGSVIRFGVGFEGEEPLSYYQDLSAHEFAHTVQKYRVRIDYQGESGAFMEAFADVFGELVEAHYSGTEPNWINAKRNMIDPSETGHNETVAGSGKSIYEMSTVLSHTAYLLHDAGVEEDVIARLWYNTMLMMPSDGTFYEVRELMELAAGNMGYADGSMVQETLKAAFDAVGICTDNSVDEVELQAENGTIQVLDFAGAPYDNYSYRLWRLEEYEEDVPVTLYPLKKQEMKKDTVKRPDPVKLGLGKGVYLLELVDDENPEKDHVYRYLCVTPTGLKNLEIETFNGEEGFGSAAFFGYVAGGEKGDEPITNATVNIATGDMYYNYRTEDYVADGTFTCTTDENGFYRFDGLPCGSYKVFAEVDGKVSEVVERSREELRRDNRVDLKIDDVSLEKLLPHLRLYFSSECGYFGMEVGAEKYYARASSTSNCMDRNFESIKPVREQPLTDDEMYSQSVASLSEVKNFQRELDCLNNLYDHMTDNVVVVLLSRRPGRMYTYEGKLYYMMDLGFGMGDPPGMSLEEAKFYQISADTCTVDVPRDMGGYYSHVDRFTFTRVDGKWKISEVERLD